MPWERRAFVFSLVGLAAWAASAFLFLPLLLYLLPRSAARIGWYTWLTFPIPLALFVLLYALRRWQDTQPPDSN